MTMMHMLFRRSCRPILFLTAAIAVGMWSVPSAAFDPELFKGLAARALGPAAMSGRITVVRPVDSNPSTIYIGTASGGVWKSVDGGMTFTPIFDRQPVHSIGAVAINPANPDIVWVGTGEADTRNSVSYGNGVYKSLDAGKTWSYMGLAGTERINAIKLDPTNPEIAYVAALGTLWAPNTERGVFKTVDGGKTWTKILYVDDSTGATDIEIDPVNPKKMFAAMWQFRRLPYHFQSGGKGSSLWRSVDGGGTWTRITEEDGLPSGDWGKADFAIAPSEPSTVYLILETAGNNVAARSDDGGYNWVITHETLNNNARPFYYTEIQVDPKNPNRVYNVESTVGVSIDRGKTFATLPSITCCSEPNAIHVDVHSLWINPSNPSHLMVGNDGGVAISYDMGKTWRFVENLPLGQFYHVHVDNDLPYNIYGGMQDNGSWKGPSEVWENGGIRNFHWQEVFFGDGFDTAPDADDSMQGYAMAQGGSLVRWNMRTGETRFIQPQPPNADTELRFNWNAGLALDPFDSATVYYGSQFLHKSVDRGTTWRIISPDLTSNKPEWRKFKETGGLTPDVTSAENYETIIAIAPSPVRKDVLWVGTDDGRLHVTRNGGKTWDSLDGKAGGVPANTWIPHITASPHEAGTAFVVYDNHRRGDMKTYVYRADNYGSRFTNLATPTVSGHALAIQQDPVNPNLLFLGTEFGLYVSWDGGRAWMKWTAGVPTASVMDIAIQKRESDLVLATHGRSAFVIDDYSALRSLSPTDFKEPLKILSVTDGIAYTVKQSPSVHFDGATGFRAPNQPYGVLITFMASGNDLPHPDADKEKARKIVKRSSSPKKDDAAPPKPTATVEVKNESGAIVRTFKADLVQGINRVVWGLQADGAKNLPYGPPPADDTLPAGPIVVPGLYTVTLKFDGHESSAKATVRQDPRIQLAPESLQANYDAAQVVIALQTKAADAVQKLLDVKTDLGTLKKLVEKAKKKKLNSDEEKSFDNFVKDIDSALDKLKKVENTFWTPPETKGFVDASTQITNYIGMAAFYVTSTFAVPSEAARFYIDLATRSLTKGESELNAILTSEVAKIRETADALNLVLLPPDAAPASPKAAADNKP